MQSFENIKLNELAAGVYELVLMRPQALNALNQKTLEELSAAITWLRENPQKARVVLVKGEGEKAFVAGADIKEMMNKNLKEALQLSRFGQEVFLQLEKLPQVTLALVQGFCLGGGLELALSCDLILATQKARFALPEVSLGLLPGYGGTLRLKERVGMGQAKAMILSGEMLDAETAKRIGLIEELLADQDEMQKKALLKAEALLAKGPLAQAAVKKLLVQSAEREQAFLNEAQAFAELFLTQDTQEGLKAFVEKRKADFKGI